MSTADTTHASPKAHSATVLAATCAALLLIAALLPILFGWTNGANLRVLVVGLLVGAGLTLAQPAGIWRRDFRNLFLLGLTVRMVLHLAVYGWASAAGGPFLSPDATLYFGKSLQLAIDDMQLPLPAYVYYGTFDCAHYYLFGAARWLWDAGLFDLQAVNIVLASLTGPLTYAIARRLDVPYALAVGAVVALYPSLIALSINDLMKDASVIGLFLMGTWAIVELWMARPSWGRGVVLAGVAILSLSYVRMSRFYVTAFLEAGILVAIALAGYRIARKQAESMSWGAIAAVVAALLLIEAIPMSFGWGSSPVMVWQAINHSLETPEMRLSAVGMVDRMQAGGQIGPRHGGDLSASGTLSVRAQDILATVTRAGKGAGSRQGLVVQPLPPPVVPVPEGPPPTLKQRLVRIAANGVRKLFGPFPWVMPPTWDARTILVGDYLMFPGMVIWYLLLPLALVGILMVPWAALRQPQFAYPLLALSAFVGILFMQYLVLNLSYRQREFMFPFLALGAAFVVRHRPASKWPMLGYAAYLGGIVLLAGVHLALRSRML